MPVGRHSTSALAVAGVLVIAAGCGGDGDGSSSEQPSSLSRAEYIEAGDEICQQLYSQRDPLEVQAAKAAEAGDAEQAAAVFENAAEITKNRVAELKELPIPEGDEAVVERIIERAEATAETARAAAEAIRAEDSKALAAESAKGARTATAFNKAAIEYGFLICGRGAAVEIG